MRVRSVATATLGATRLSIIDLPGGGQPLSNPDGTVWVTLNGEIYNHVELRRELLARGHRFSTRSDTEVLVHLYEEMEMDLLERLNGMFAFALWDAAREELFLARDRLGIKPLYYAHRHGVLQWASELKALLADRVLPRTVDQEALAEYLTLLYIPHPRTPFSHVRKLEPGTYLRHRAGTITAHRYWRYPPPFGQAGASIGELCEEIVSLIGDGVRLQLRADVPVAVFASGASTRQPSCGRRPRRGSPWRRSWSSSTTSTSTPRTPAWPRRRPAWPSRSCA